MVTIEVNFSLTSFKPIVFEKRRVTRFHGAADPQERNREPRSRRRLPTVNRSLDVLVLPLVHPAPPGEDELRLRLRELLDLAFDVHVVLVDVVDVLVLL